MRILRIRNTKLKTAGYAAHVNGDKKYQNISVVFRLL